MPTNPEQTPELPIGPIGPVRIFFSMWLRHVIPAMPVGKPRATQAAQRAAERDLALWRDSFCLGLARDIGERLAPLGFVVGFKKIERVGRNGGASSISFVISRLHVFQKSELSASAHHSLRVKLRPITVVTSKLQLEIAEALRNEYYIARLSHSYIACRVYVFEIFYAGTLVVERIFSDDELREYDTVSEALEVFQDEISSSFDHPFSVSTSQHNLTRRTRDNQYKFEVSANPYISFGEDGVFGDGATAIDWNASTDEFSAAYVEWRDDELDPETENLRWAFQEACGLLPDNVRVIDSSIDFCDWSDDLVEVIDEFDHG